MAQKRSRVFVGMSGGVDSSVSAALLKEDGHDVTGVFIKVWQADFLPCNWREERRDAMRAAAHLGIPFMTLDLEKEYKREVVDYMIREYGAGRVPNPDVMCNKHVKFGAFLEFAKKHGADHIATGHYAQNVGHSKPSSRSTEKLPLGTRYLLSGADTEKDQSYFLWTLTQAELAHTLFPVGTLKKSEVRALARSFGLPNAEKKDSQGLCFMGKIDMADFLKHYLKTTDGDVLDEEGHVIGHHEGAMLYTIGQRHGFSVRTQNSSGTPLYVIAKDLSRNTITVSRHEDIVGSGTKTVSIGSVNNISGALFHAGEDLTARIRYRGELHPIASFNSSTVEFAHPVEEITSGQSIVFYVGEECLGGAVIQ